MPLIAKKSTVKRTIKWLLVVSAICCSLGTVSIAENRPNASLEPVWIDVRNWLEYKLDHIPGDLRVHYTNIVQQVSKAYPNTNTPIRVYCAAGVRAGMAQAALENAGYTQVENAGSIDDARRLRGSLALN